MILRLLCSARTAKMNSIYKSALSSHVKVSPKTVLEGVRVRPISTVLLKKKIRPNATSNEASVHTQFWRLYWKFMLFREGTFNGDFCLSVPKLSEQYKKWHSTSGPHSSTVGLLPISLGFMTAFCWDINREKKVQEREFLLAAMVGNIDRLKVR